MSKRWWRRRVKQLQRTLTLVREDLVNLQLAHVKRSLHDAVAQRQLNDVTARLTLLEDPGAEACEWLDVTTLNPNHPACVAYDLGRRDALLMWPPESPGYHYLLGYNEALADEDNP